MAHADDIAAAVEAAPAGGTARREPVAEDADQGARARPEETDRETRDRAWVGHPLDIRVSFWTPLGRVYLVILGGPERRAPGRRREERKRHPLLGLNNVLVVVGFAAILVGAAVLGSASGLYIARWMLGS